VTNVPNDFPHYEAVRSFFRRAVKSGRWDDFPHYEAVRSFFRRAVKSGRWEQALDLLVKKTEEAKNANPPQATHLSTHKIQRPL